MNQFKRAKVVILPTEDSSTLCLGGNLSIIYSPNSKITLESTWRELQRVNKEFNTSYTPQHLYIISDDEIKEGDVALTPRNHIGKVLRIEKTFIVVQDYGSFNIGSCKKIIATTDTSLGIVIQKFTSGNKGVIDVSEKILLAQPSQQFIEKYIESYNKGEIITDVLIEYESYCKHGNNCPSKGAYNKQHLCDVEYKLKINLKDNTITIKKLKDSWNKEEVVELLHKLNIDT